MRWGLRRRTTAVALLGLVGTLGAATAHGADPAIACSWTVETYGRGGANVGWTDLNSTGYVMSYSATPGGRLVITGKFARARFFVIDVYDAKGNPFVPDLLDSTLQPDPGTSNPYRTRSTGPARFTATVAFNAPPAHRAPNTVYAGRTFDGTAPNGGGTIALRVYLPDVAGQRSGGVALPEVTHYPTASARGIPLRPCPTPHTVPGQIAVTHALANAPNARAPFPAAQNPPVWETSTNPSVDSVIGQDNLPRTGIGLLTTPNNSYLQTRISQQYAPVFVMRAKAPTSPDTRAGEWVGVRRQLRYWSVCEFSTTTNESIECLSDHEIRRDASGFFTLVVSDPRHRPNNAANWLPFGVYEGWLTYRQFLPDPAYHASIQSAAMTADVKAAMGAYYPRSGYCTTAAFQSRGAGCVQ